MPEPCWEQEGKRNRAGREHPIQFRNGAGSQYKHKGFITGGSPSKAGANSPSSSTRRGNIREGRREGATKRSASQRGDVTQRPEKRDGIKNRPSSSYFALKERVFTTKSATKSILMPY